MKNWSIVVLTFFVFTSKAQDTLRLCQTNSPWVSNCYYFYSNGGREGQFEKDMESDDCQRWSGVGTYRIQGKKIILSPYMLIRTKGNLRIDYSSINDSGVDAACDYTGKKDTSYTQSKIFHQKGSRFFSYGLRKWYGRRTKTWFAIEKMTAR